MIDVAVIASPRDREYAAAVGTILKRLGAPIAISEKLPAQQVSRVILVWSAALAEIHSIDARALIGLWSEGRLTTVRLDATPLPLGMRDLPSLPPGTAPRAVVDALKPAKRASQSKPEDPKLKPKARTLRAAVGLLTVLFLLGGIYWYLTAGQRARQVELTARLEAAAKASAQLNKEKGAEVEAQKKLAEKTEVAAVAPKVEAPKVEAPKVEAAKVEAPKAETVKAAPPKAKSRSEREGEEEDRLAREIAAKKNAQVAAVSPSAPSPGAAAPPAASAPDLLAQAQAMEGSDPRGALKIYRSLARRGNGKAAKRLGDIYDRGLPGVPRDYQESLSWYARAHELGEDASMASRRNGERAQAPAPRPASPPTEAARPVEPAASPRPVPAPVEATKAEPAARAPLVEARKPAPPPAPAHESEWPKIVVALAVLALAAYAWRRARRAAPTAAEGAAAAASAATESALLFVSYSHKDKARIEPIVSLIEQSGRKVWMDRTGITGQAGWAGQIVRAIRQSRAVVLMASPNSYASDQVVRELYLAMNHKKPIVPIEIEPADLPDELQYILAPFQHHRLSAGAPREVLGRALAAV